MPTAKNGRGIGEGKDYIPWIKTFEFSSKGRVSRLKGVKIDRLFHLQSDNMLRAFLIFEWNDSVVDIRESFPLLDVMEVINDKENLRFDKFSTKNNEQIVITTSFLLTLINSNGERINVARTVKNSTELSRKITWEKLEIEHRYWSSKDVDWKVITEKQLPRQYCKNIEWVRETLLNNNEDFSVDEFTGTLISFMLKNEELSLKEVLREFEKIHHLKPGTGIYLFRYIVAKKLIRIDMFKEVNIGLPVKKIILV